MSGWGGVRLSYIPAEIAELGNKYPPARAALLERRDAREELIRAGETDFSVVMEWTSLNCYLNDQERELVLLQEMTSNGTISDSVKERIISENYERLLDEGRYDILAPFLNDFGRDFFHWEIEFESQRVFPRHIDNPNWNDDEMLEHSRQTVKKEGLKLFELALGCKSEPQADEVARRILKHCNDADGYIKLFQAATRAKSKKKARAILALAKEALSKADYKTVSDTCKT